MRISLHIVVALLLIALIYREILKGILPPVCGNNWQALRSARSAALLDSIHAALVLNRCIFILFPQISLLLPEISLQSLWNMWLYSRRHVLMRAFVYNNSFLHLCLLFPCHLCFLQDSEAAAENGNREPGQSLPFWLK